MNGITLYQSLMNGQIGKIGFLFRFLFLPKDHRALALKLLQVNANRADSPSSS